MASIKVRRTHREELAGIQILKQAVAQEAGLTGGTPRQLDLEGAVDPELAHLQAHDPDGFFCALDRDETLGFAAAHIRSRQWVLSEMWVLPQHQGKGAGGALLRRLLAYGERSGAREHLAMVPPLPSIQALLLGAGLESLCPVHLVELPAEGADVAASSLSRTLPGQDMTRELLKRRGQADLDRLDRLVRRVTREVDHVFWIKERGLNLALVRQGERIAAYGYGGAGQVGPVAGSTREAALAGLGWAISLARKTGAGPLEVLVPAPFGEALDALFDAGGRIRRTLLLYGSGVQIQPDRWIPGRRNLP